MSKVKDYVRIRLNQGYWAIVDRADEVACLQYHWHVHFSKVKVYATHYKMGRMHRWLLDAPTGIQVDHKNGDGLDNRRSNIRLATQGQNSHNQRKRKGCSSKFKGVSFDSIRQLWSADIWLQGKNKNLGKYTTQLEAAIVYDAKIVEVYGPFARMNFPERLHVIKTRRRKK